MRLGKQKGEQVEPRYSSPSQWKSQDARWEGQKKTVKKRVNGSKRLKRKMHESDSRNAWEIKMLMPEEFAFLHNYHFLLWHIPVLSSSSCDAT